MVASLIKNMFSTTSHSDMRPKYNCFLYHHIWVKLQDAQNNRQCLFFLWITRLYSVNNALWHSVAVPRNTSKAWPQRAARNTTGQLPEGGENTISYRIPSKVWQWPTNTKSPHVVGNKLEVSRQIQTQLLFFHKVQSGTIMALFFNSHRMWSQRRKC